MANFLQISEPEAAALDAQSDAMGDKQRLHDMAAKSLISQYGAQAADPDMWNNSVVANQAQQVSPDEIANSHLDADQKQRADQAWQGQHAIAFIKSQVDNGVDPAAAIGNLTPETYKALGVSPEQVGQLVEAVKANPKLIDQIGDALSPDSGKSKMVGGVQWATAKDGKYHAMFPIQDAKGNITYQEAGSLPEGYSLLGETPGQKDATTVRAGYVPPSMGGGGGSDGGGAAAKPDLTTIKAPGGQSLTVNQAISTQAAGLLQDMQAAGYKVTDVGGYNNRNVAGTNIASAHSAGLALDINPTENADHTAGNIPPDVARALAKKWGAAWGGDFKSNKDPMHFSWASSEGGSIPWKASGPASSDGTAPPLQLTPAAQAARDRIDISRERLGLAAQHEARMASSSSGGLMSPDTVDYLADQYRTTGKLPPMGQGSAVLRMQVYNRAAQKAAAAGATGESDAYHAQATHERGTAVNDLGKSTPTSAGGRIQSANALVAHLDQLNELSSALTSGQLPAINSAKQKYMQWSGSAAPTNFNAVKAIAADEAVKFIVANGGTLADRKQAQEIFAPAQSPQQLQQAITQVQHLATGQLAGIRQRYQAIGATQDFDGTLTPRTKQLLGAGQAPAPPAPGQAAPANTASLRAKYGL